LKCHRLGCGAVGAASPYKAAQGQHLDEQYESDLHESERATDLGDYRYNDNLAAHSLAAALRREKINESFLV